MAHRASRTEDRTERALLPLRAGSINAGLRSRTLVVLATKGQQDPIYKISVLARDTTAFGQNVIFRQSEIRHKFLAQRRLQRKQRLDAQNIKTSRHRNQIHGVK